MSFSLFIHSTLLHLSSTRRIGPVGCRQTRSISISKHRLPASALLASCFPCVPVSLIPIHPSFPPHPPQNMSVTLQPSNSIGFNRAYFLPSSDFLLSHIRHSSRSSDTGPETLPKHHKPQCRSCIIQNQDDCSQGAPFSCSNVSSPHLYPQLYCVRPNSGKVDPGQTVEVQGAISLIVFNAVG